MLDSQKQVENLSAKLEVLMQEKSKLETRNNVLEKVRSCGNLILVLTRNSVVSGGLRCRAPGVCQ
jgi:hypothetical protein